MVHKEKYDFNDLLEIMARLRAENGCPWDREQTHESLRIYMLEETYEVLEALESGTRANFATNWRSFAPDSIPCTDSERNR